MGLFDVFVPAELPYPGAPATNPRALTAPSVQVANGNTQPQAAQPSAAGVGGFLNKLFAPSDLPYPMAVVVAPTATPTQPSLTQLPTASGAAAQPVVAVSVAPAPAPTAAPVAVPAVTAPASAAPAPAPAEPTIATPAPSSPSPTAPAPMQPQSIIVPAPAPQVTVVLAPFSLPNLQPCPVDDHATLPSTPAPSVSTNGVTPAPTTDPTPTPPAAPTPVVLESVDPSDDDIAEKIVTAYSTNPRLRARNPRAQEVFLEDVLGEQIMGRMITSKSEPLAFAVPDGCNAVDVYVSPIEVNTEHGCDENLEEVVTIGELLIAGADGTLVPGDQVTVVVPWRHASWVELAAHHLRVAITARFYKQSN